MKKFCNFLKSVLILIFVCLFLFKPSYSYATLQENKSIKVIFSQTDNGDLSTKEVSLIDYIPYDYKLNLQYAYYNIQMLDGNGNALFSGKVSSKSIIYSDDFSSISNSEGSLSTQSYSDDTNEQNSDDHGENSYITKRPNLDVSSPPEIDLYLPYYDEASRVVISDEEGNAKLDISLADYRLNTTDEPVLGSQKTAIPVVKPTEITPSFRFHSFWENILKLVRLR